MDHGVIVKILASNICGTDLHMYRGTIAEPHAGLIFGHENTGEIFELGSAVERFKVGDIVSVPFNIACGKCDNVRREKTTNHRRQPASGRQTGVQWNARVLIRCRPRVVRLFQCREQKTSACLNANPSKTGGIYGFAGKVNRAADT